MPQPAVKNTKEKFAGALHTLQPIRADSNDELPSEIMLVKSGTWPNSVKGALKITKADLEEMKANFDNGVGRAGGGSIGLPIDFSHNEWAEAAGWIEEVEVRGNALWATKLEWSDVGRTAILGKRFKCLSPSFYPSDRGGYVDPEDYDSEAKPNTLVGAALTNIPFFKGLTAVKADKFAEDDNDDNMLFISDIKNEKDLKMSKTLDEVRILEASALEADDKALLEAHKDELSQEEKVKFGFTTAPVEADQFSAEDRQVLADIRDGKKVVMSKEDVDALNAKVESSAEATKALTRAAIEQEITDKHIARGAIKADQLERWATLIEADEANKELLENLPDNKLVADENEIGDEGKDKVDAAVELQEKTVEVMKIAASAGTKLTYAEAKKQAQEALKEGK
ncbi:MAG: hypothetical protein KGZ81_07375 [Flavobacteriales bacterium]|nr:hypothetical protein [Flavobacteriales bacterium]